MRTTDIMAAVLCAMLTIAAANSAWALPVTSVGNVQFIAQISGASAPTSMEHRWGVSGTDIGTMFNDFAGNTFIAFGDSFGFVTGTGPGAPSNALHNWRPNLLARTSDKTASNGLDLAWMSTDRANHAAAFIANNDTTTIPTGGVSLGSTLYMHYMNVNSAFADNGVWTVAGSGIASSYDYGQTWLKTNMWLANSFFAQVAMLKSGSTVYLYGTKAGRHDCMKLARVTNSTPNALSSYSYWNGSNYVSSESSAICLRIELRPGVFINLTPVSEASVVFNAFLGRYLMMYLNEDNDRIQLTSSASIEGPWSPPVNLQDFAREYAPMLVPGWSDGQDIYFALSVFDPYNVWLVKATLNSSVELFGPYSVPGRVEAENFREGGEGVAYHDTSSGNSGAFFRSGNVDTPWGPEDAWMVAGEANEWLAYRVNVATTGSYKVRLKYSSQDTGCQVKVDAPGGTPLYATATLNPTGSNSEYVVWESPDPFNLTTGIQFIDLYFPSGKCNVTWFEIIPASQSTLLRVDVGNVNSPAYVDPAGQAWSADLFWLSGGTAGTPSVAIDNTRDDVLYASDRHGPMTATFSMANGPYQVRLKFVETFWTAINKRKFNVDIEGVRMLTDYDVFARAGGQNIAKDEVFDVWVTDGTLNISLSNGSNDRPILSGIELRGGNPLLYRNNVPGHVEAEDYKPGDYYDVSSGNAGGVLRGGDVDVRTKAAGGGYQVGWTDSGEWIAYDVNVTASGTYRFRMRYSGGCRVQVDTDGSPVYVPATYVTNTGSPDSFTTWSPTNTFNLNQGQLDINIYFPVGGCDVDYFEIY